MGNAMRVDRSARTALFFVGVLMLGSFASLAFASPAHAQAPCDPYATSCRPIVPPPIVKRARQDRPDPDRPVPPVVIHERQRLPFTGADLTLFAATGLAAVGTGTVLVRATRSRRARA